MTQVKDKGYYLGLRWTVILRKDEEGDILARIAELKGCLTHGSDRNQALANLDDMLTAWIEDALGAGIPIPEPQP